MKPKANYLRPGSPDRLNPEARAQKEQLCDRAVRVLQQLGVQVVREDFGVRGGTGMKTWFVTLADMNRYLLVVRDTKHQQLVVLPRRTAGEVQRTIATLGHDEEGLPVDEQAEQVIDLETAQAYRVQS